MLTMEMIDSTPLVVMSILAVAVGVLLAVLK